MLDDHLFSLDLESWEASIVTEKERVRLKLLHGTYHEKFQRDEGRGGLAREE
jgi:hypothetical protein